MAKAHFLSLIKTPLNNDMAIIGLILCGNEATFIVAANTIKLNPMMKVVLF
jgi:hypothetical protein